MLFFYNSKNNQLYGIYYYQLNQYVNATIVTISDQGSTVIVKEFAILELGKEKLFEPDYSVPILYPPKMIQIDSSCWSFAMQYTYFDQSTQHLYIFSTVVGQSWIIDMGDPKLPFIISYKDFDFLVPMHVGGDEFVALKESNIVQVNALTGTYKPLGFNSNVASIYPHVTFDPVINNILYVTVNENCLSDTTRYNFLGFNLNENKYASTSFLWMSSGTSANGRYQPVSAQIFFCKD